MAAAILSALRAAASGLPAQFAALVVLMGALMGGLLLVIDREARHREAVYAPLLATCLRVMEGPLR